MKCFCFLLHWRMIRNQEENLKSLSLWSWSRIFSMILSWRCKKNFDIVPGFCDGDVKKNFDIVPGKDSPREQRPQEGRRDGNKKTRPVTESGCSFVCLFFGDLMMIIWRSWSNDSLSGARARQWQRLGVGEQGRQMSDYSIEIHDPRNKETNERGHGGLFFVSKLFSGLLEKNTHRFFLFQATPHCPSLAGLLSLVWSIPSSFPPGNWSWRPSTVSPITINGVMMRLADHLILASKCDHLIIW